MTDPACIIGIDIGLKGAIAFTWWRHNMDAEGYQDRKLLKACVHDLPHKDLWHRRSLDTLALQGLIEDKCSIAPAVVACEVPLASYNNMGNSGKSMVTSIANFGRMTCALEGVLEKDRVFFIAPNTWKAHVGVSKDKNEAIRLATEIFPCQADRFSEKAKNGKVSIKDGRAEALLIAYYAMNNLWLPNRG